ncbi:hypothetical protein SDC9_116301 [bioreactor metagenome]|uniref:Uncharacterized protein n=1 Tax=bioreactor metagenome TaxID=1076179 RepID=A0A645BV52_9ZZZZ
MQRIALHVKILSQRHHLRLTAREEHPVIIEGIGLHPCQQLLRRTAGITADQQQRRRNHTQQDGQKMVSSFLFHHNRPLRSVSAVFHAQSLAFSHWHIRAIYCSFSSTKLIWRQARKSSHFALGIRSYMYLAI